nr:hypothetical protein HAGR004_29880 [Bdellovibrio sp. HAGR004]
MKQFSKALLGTAIVFATSTAVAGYDEFDCRSSGNLKLAHLQCVTCGAQKYFAKKAPNREVVPSEKWLALLGTSAVQNFKLGGANKTIVESDAAKEDYQKVVISMLRNYGFCQNYSNSKTPKDPTRSDIKADEWRAYIYPATTRSSGVDKGAINKLGKYYGFDDSFWGWDAGEKMNFLIAGSPEPHRNYKQGEEDFNAKYPLYTDQKSQERRSRFKERLSQAFPSEYDVSGERKSDVKKIIASKDKANGLDTCLEEVNRIQNGAGDPLLNSFLNNTAENQEFCKSMASACDIKLDFCTGSKGSEHQTQPKPFSNPTPPGLKKQPSSGGGAGVR